jgi:hypothetical protein
MKRSLLLPVLSVLTSAAVLLLVLRDGCQEPEGDGDSVHIPPTLSHAEKPKHQLDREALAAALDQAGGDPDPVMRLFDKSSSTLVRARWLGIEPDDVLADIGVGTGALPLRLLARGTPFEHYHAVDIDQPSLELLDLLLERLDLPASERVTTVLATPTDCGLPEASVDIFLLVDVAPLGCEPDENTDPFLTSLFRAARPGARLHHLLARFPEGSQYPRRDCVSQDIIALYEQAGFVLHQHSVRPEVGPDGVAMEHSELRRPQ